jgi:D-alanyl-D-alanine carboxypeptidase (penicillin-binding protein 5/6)
MSAVGPRRSRPKWAALIIGAVVVLSAGFYLPMTLLAPIAPISAQDASPAAATTRLPAALAWPGTQASAIGSPDFPDLQLSSGATDQRPMASITKIITTLVVLSVKPLSVGEQGPPITFTASDVAMYNKYLAENGAVQPVEVGESLSQLQVNEVMLVASANNYAESYATWAFGSEAKFLTAARAWLTANGLTHTTIADTCGMNAGSTSTASDLVALGKLALANPVVAGIVSTQTLSSVPEAGTLHNSNDLLGVSGVDGIKTGTLVNVGSNLLFSTDFQFGSRKVTVVGVILGSTNKATLDAAVKALLASVKKGFHDVTLSTAGQSFASYSTPWDSTSQAVASTGESVLVWGDTPIATTVTTKSMSLAKAGAAAGSVTFTVGKSTIVVPLTLKQPLSDPGALWRLSNPLKLAG